MRRDLILIATRVPRYLRLKKNEAREKKGGKFSEGEDENKFLRHGHPRL